MTSGCVEVGADFDQPTPATERNSVWMAINRLRLLSGTFVAMVECRVASMGSVWCAAPRADRRSLHTRTERACAIGGGVRQSVQTAFTVFSFLGFGFCTDFSDTHQIAPTCTACGTSLRLPVCDDRLPGPTNWPFEQPGRHPKPSGTALPARQSHHDRVPGRRPNPNGSAALAHTWPCVLSSSAASLTTGNPGHSQLPAATTIA